MKYDNFIIEKIANNYFNNTIIKKNDTVVIALSGGPDSMCLLDVFYKLNDVFHFKLKAIHVHHRIRDKEADRDLNFVKDYCKSIDVELMYSYVDAKGYSKKNHLSLEESARILRYKELDRMYNRESFHNKNNVYILVAHHMSDQVETIIHNMCRGTGIKGICGMREKVSYILRPFLNIKKEEIDKYIKDFGIPYVTDSTNNDVDYKRNYIRKEIMPKFLSVNDKSFNHIIDLSNDIYELQKYIDELSEYVFKNITTSENENSIILNLKLFNNTSHIIKCEIIKKVINHLVSTLKDFSRVNIEDVITLSMKEKGGHIDLPYNITVDKKQNMLVFTKNNKNISMLKKKNK